MPVLTIRIAIRALDGNSGADGDGQSAPLAAGIGADAEVVLLAAEALGGIGIEGLSIDLNLPPLVGALAADLDIGARTSALRPGPEIAILHPSPGQPVER